MDIEKILREYKIKKSLVETTQARIEQYKYALSHPEMWYKDYIPPSREIGMPGKPHGSGVPKSPVEVFVTEKELSEDEIKNWIRDDESRIFLIKLEVEQIDKALTGLTGQERCVIELKYFENMFWRDIEINFNNRFRQHNYISDIRLKQINKEALNKLNQILLPFYEKVV